MNTIKYLLLIIAFIFLSANGIFSQNRPFWVYEIETILNKGDWKTSYKRWYQIKGSEKFHSVQMQLLYKEEISITIDINLRGSEKEAQDLLRLGLSNEKKKELVKNQLKIGDESIANRANSNWIYLRFRKGRVFTEVMSSTEDTAIMLGQLLANEISAKK